MEKLALHGGVPVRKDPLPLFEVNLGEEESKNVLEVLKSRKLVQTHGIWANKFGEMIKDYLGSKYIVLANNGTSTMHLSLIALDIGPGDEVICSPLGWISSGTPSLYQNAIPIYADVDPEFGFINPEDVRKKITSRTKAISVVHTWGLPADLDPILEIGEQYNIPIVEDAAEALGASYKNCKVGTLGIFGSFSTVWNKIITTGEGGFLVSDDQFLADKAKHYGNFAKVPGKGDYFDGLGYNYRMTELMGALGVGQVKRIENNISIRRENAAFLSKQLESLEIDGLQIPKEPNYGKGVWWKYTLLLELKQFCASRDEIVKAIRSEGILCDAPVLPDNLQPFYQNHQIYGTTKCPWDCHYYTGLSLVDYSKMCPEAANYSDRAIWLTGCSPSLNRNDLDSIIHAVEKVLKWYKIN
ncbi:MAG: DegT/DnrJ/EryC1/StrS family aminotransferase [Candidatus Heimdallarchaeota archaeon]|nr:DegT/DnrJ/EryC1/StrS family aminotransferase [Candidatus Heimdallarchaeota archaeon]